ncbi:hypothetical protein KFE25_000412 [Diacronema lutheri]|uniref:EF-hand domain-containing protein n=1 Tax=Diacronema lutheri TaxID=2081491 RepID=A0A8J5XE76_DIALT|nr:hypothetical protein KFE25_000412 [Diacronema lutheri]
MRLDHHRAAAARRGAPAPAVRLCAPSGASEPFVHTRPDGHGAVEHGGARYAPRDLLDTTPARLHPLDLSCGGGFLSSPDPADHEPWDRPLFRRVVVRPMERLASRFALVSPRPLLIGLIAILAKEIATRQIETDLLNTPDDAVWKPSALGIVRQAQANLDRRIKLIVRKGYAAMLDDELRAVREDPIGAILHSNLLGEASTIFSRQVSNVTMELASSIEDQVIESLELISTGLPDEDDADTQPAHAQPAALAVAARGGAGAAAVDGAGAYGDGGGAQRPWYWLWPVRLTLQPRPTRPRVPVHRPAVDFGADGGDGDGDGPNAIERVAEASDRVSGPEVALRAARVGASSAAVEWAHRAEAGASDRTSVARAGAARADARPRVGQPELLLLPPPPTGRERVRGFVRRAWAGATAGAGRGLSDVRAAALSALGGLPSFGWGVGVSVGAAARAQPPPLLALPQEAVRSRLRNLLARVDALVKRVDRDGNDELTLDELLALIYDDAQQPAPWGVPGARGAAGETRRFAPAAVAWAEGLDAETIAAIRSMVLIKATSRARTVWDRLQAIALAPIVVALNQTGVTARASVVRFGEYVSDADLNGDGELTADEVLQALLGDDVPLCEPLRTRLSTWVVFGVRDGPYRWWQSVPDALAVQALVDLNSTGVVRSTALAISTIGRVSGLYDERGANESAAGAIVRARAARRDARARERALHEQAADAAANGAAAADRGETARARGAPSLPRATAVDGVFGVRRLLGWRPARRKPR